MCTQARVDAVGTNHEVGLATVHHFCVTANGKCQAGTFSRKVETSEVMTRLDRIGAQTPVNLVKQNGV